MPTSYTPPSERLWWNEPIERTEILWIVIAFAWCLFMFYYMIAWHWTGKQNLANEAYKITPEAYGKKVQAMVEQYTVRKETEQNIPVVRPPAGSDVYLAGSLWQWRPLLELEKGKSYRLHVSSLDWMHGFSLQPENINLQVLPGYEMVITVTPNKTGTNTVMCNEYCGIGHHTMLGKIYVK
ncbi:MAG: cytochrome C oxidase subunit II [Candidatus Muproteobacteria bacterium RBG_19FT_COMBO_61_10]|uniref:Cytochrome C oxidase subunit II n=2 Tax=Candidatus Muproteobacteria TaxID=1817795 RepID=A0A1F6UMY8_9PROT|nr:MAG: cytochrome C oxidase subunit II [Candidatus Muproteobacteria bacterium RIFCSPHIGHO2_01_FULL_65_16]OGI58706.1 MAG: cytochrome C oxidase subunit II [Candidatus Muproteobacteria bacterium RBG_19FT_COMBO_61_10]